MSIIDKLYGRKTAASGVKGSKIIQNSINVAAAAIHSNIREDRKTFTKENIKKFINKYLNESDQLIGMEISREKAFRLIKKRLHYIVQHTF